MHDVMHGYAQLRSYLRKAVASHFTLAPASPKLKSRYWFPAKRYGWGWGFPICWEGRAVTLIYLSMILSGTRFAETSLHLMVLIIGIAVVGFLGVCLWKGERPHWRWGREPVVPMD